MDATSCTALGYAVNILISLIAGVTDSLSMPSFQTIVPSLVTTKEIPQAVSLNAIQFNLSRTLGPAIAGVVIVQFGALVCFGLNAFSYIPFFLSIFWIYPTKGFKTNLQDQNLEQQSMKSTIKDVFNQKSLSLYFTNHDKQHRQFKFTINGYK